MMTIEIKKDETPTIPPGHYACYGCGRVHKPEDSKPQCAPPCRGCGFYHGRDTLQIKCLTEALDGVLRRLQLERREHEVALASLRAANRAAVEAASLPVSKGGMAEARRDAGKK